MSNYHKRYDKELVSSFPNRSELKIDVVERRNDLLLHFFSKVDMDICWIADPQKPAVIVNKSYCLSAFVSNFNLHFTDAPFNGNVVKTYKLKKGEQISHNDFMYYFRTYDHRPVYKLRFGETMLFLAGYNHVDRSNREGRYPVFSAIDYRLYFNRQSLEDIVEEFKNYPLKIE